MSPLNIPPPPPPPPPLSPRPSPSEKKYSQNPFSPLKPFGGSMPPKNQTTPSTNQASPNKGFFSRLFSQRLKPKKIVKTTVKPKSNSIFGEKGELTRSQFRQKLRYDPNVFRAAVPLGLSREQRVALEKKIPSAYGYNISRSDLKATILKLHRQYMSTKTILEKTALRKKIIFLKKIIK